jgi:hypothetical protein
MSANDPQSMINNLGQEIDERQLQTLYKTDPGFRTLIDFFAVQDEDYHVITVDELQEKMASAGINANRHQIIQMLRTLEGGHRGFVWLGRRDSKTRFEFTASSKAIAKAARQTSKAPVVHKFRLRPDLEVSFELPIDLSQKEVHRISEFLKSLPFDDAMPEHDSNGQ